MKSYCATAGIFVANPGIVVRNLSCYAPPAWIFYVLCIIWGVVSGWFNTFYGLFTIKI